VAAPVAFVAAHACFGTEPRRVHASQDLSSGERRRERRRLGIAAEGEEISGRGQGWPRLEYSYNARNRINAVMAAGRIGVAQG
jgi:hypothetical protein